MESLLKEISRCKDDVVIVGSWVSRIHNKLREEPNDIDVVVTSLDGLEGFGEIICYESKGLYSENAKRCYIKNSDGKIDIWVRDKLPEWEIINGVKYQTIDAQLKYYHKIKDSTDNKFLKSLLNRKIKTLNLSEVSFCVTAPTPTIEYYSCG
jgi:hypothetical protein